MVLENENKEERSHSKANNFFIRESMKKRPNKTKMHYNDSKFKGEMNEIASK